MRGQEPLLEIRRMGKQPIGGVMVDANPAGDTWHRDWAPAGLSMAMVDIDPTEPVERLDLRFARDLAVQVSGTDEARVGELAKAFVMAGARSVIAGCGHWINRDEFRVTRMAFTPEEVAAWPA